MAKKIDEKLALQLLGENSKNAFIAGTVHCSRSSLNNHINRFISNELLECNGLRGVKSQYCLTEKGAAYIQGTKGQTEAVNDSPVPESPACCEEAMPDENHPVIRQFQHWMKSRKLVSLADNEIDPEATILCVCLDSNSAIDLLSVTDRFMQKLLSQPEADFFRCVMVSFMREKNLNRKILRKEKKNLLCQVSRSLNIHLSRMHEINLAPSVETFYDLDRVTEIFIKQEGRDKQLSADEFKKGIKISSGG